MNCELPNLIWGEAENKMRMDDGFHSTEARRKARVEGIPPIKRLSRKQRVDTPRLFAAIILRMVRRTEG